MGQTWYVLEWVMLCGVDSLENTMGNVVVGVLREFRMLWIRLCAVCHNIRGWLMPFQRWSGVVGDAAGCGTLSSVRIVFAVSKVLWGICFILQRNVCTEAGMFAIRAERDYVIDEDFNKAVRKVAEAKKLEGSSHSYKQY